LVGIDFDWNYNFTGRTKRSPLLFEKEEDLIDYTLAQDEDSGLNLYE